MRPSERFVLRWDDFLANTRSAFKELRGKEEFTDLTLVGGDGKQVGAHQVIMAGGSSFIHKILRENPHPHPLIYLKGVKYEHLLSLLDFVYTGEANIVEDNLNEFLDIAEDLKVKGLTLTNNTLEKADDQYPKLNPTTPASLRRRKAQELGSSPKVWHPRSTISSQDPKAAEDRASAPVVSHLRCVMSAASRGPADTEVNPPKPGVEKPCSVMSAPHQGHVVTEGRASASGVSHLHAPQDPAAMEGRASTNPQSVISSSNNNKFSQSPGNEDHDDTCNIKVEVGDAAHFNVYNGTNEHGEQYISNVSLRVGDKTGGAVLSMEQEENVPPLSTEKQIKEEKMVSTSNVDITKAVDGTDVMSNDEQSIHDWYEQSGENDIIMAQDQDNDIEVDPNLDMVGTEMVDSAFVNEELAQHSCDDNMMPDEEQDFLLNFKKKDFHTDEKAVQCSVCLKMFSTSGSLNRHKRLHTGEKPYQCQVCSKQFTSYKSLARHKRVHTGEKSYQCTQCPKTFSRKDSLEIHKRVHTGEKPYQCPHCPKTFSDLSNLDKHRRVHTGEKPYQCPYCPKTFLRKDSLETHKRVHTGEKPYQCPLCPEAFSQKGNMDRHKEVHSVASYINNNKNVHTDKKAYRMVHTVNKPHTRVHTVKKPHQCVLCSQRFTQFIDLKRHRKKKCSM